MSPTPPEAEAPASCCTMAARDGDPAATQEIAGMAPVALRNSMRAAAAPIPGGRVQVGTDRPHLPQDGEGPQRIVPLRPFRMSRTTVTNAAFGAFIAATGYRTDAERYGWSFVFHLDLPDDMPPTQGVMGAEWWRRVDDATWDAPEGPGSTIAGREDHPAVHVSWNDAIAYAAWIGGRLPSEAEWEHAARGGLKGATYPWGNDEPDDLAFMPCNIWQGRFPMNDTGADGFRGLAPAESFQPNGYGLFNMSGNCWEWNAEPFLIRSMKRQAQLLNAQTRAENRRLLKGGSHLCHKSYCYRYRIAARIGNPPDTTTGHAGFRIAFDA